MRLVKLDIKKKYPACNNINDFFFCVQLEQLNNGDHEDIASCCIIGENFRIYVCFYFLPHDFFFFSFISVQLAVAVELSLASTACGSYGQEPCLYLPAKPGQTPPCASKGSTFCETVDSYPE